MPIAQQVRAVDQVAAHGHRFAARTTTAVLHPPIAPSRLIAGSPAGRGR